jgi:GDP-L-fucose synthase
MVLRKIFLVQAQTYRQKYGFNAIYLLPVNPYGPCDNFELRTSYVIPAMIRKFLEAKERGENEVIVWRNGFFKREFLYVEDDTEGITLAAERYHNSEPVNLGSGMEISIKDLVELIAHLVGFDGTLIWD